MLVPVLVFIVWIGVYPSAFTGKTEATIAALLAQVHSKAGVAMAVSLADGRDLWTQRLPASTWASPLAAGDRVYFFCTNGETVVAKAGDTFEKLAQSTLTIDDRIYGYAIAGDRLVLRSGQKLFCVAP